MTARARKASGGMSATASALGAAPSPAHADRNGAGGPSGWHVLSWEKWFQRAGPAQRAEMLALAARQGLLYAHQLPPLVNGVNGVKDVTSQRDPGNVEVLARLLAGKTEDLTPATIEPVRCIDQELDSAQREAVARALATPDLFLLQGLPGTGRSRVVAEILRQSASRGERVLFLANHAASLDAALRRLALDQAALPLRFLEPGESPATLCAEVLACTLSQRQRLFKEEALKKAAEARAQAQARVARRQAEAACWTRLPELADQLVEARQRLQQCQEHLAKLSADVQAQVAAGTLPKTLADKLVQLERDHLAVIERIDEEHDKHEQQQAQCVRELAEVDQALEALRPLAEAKLARRWWSLVWWRAAFRGQVREKMAELVGRRQDSETASQKLTRLHKENRERCQVLENAYQATRTRLLDDEVERRRQTVLQKENDLRRQLQEVVSHWREQLDILETPDHRPLEETRTALALAAAAWEGQRRLDEEACQFAHDWEEYLRGATDHIASEVPGWANVLAGTLTAWSKDPTFAAAAAGPVDLLVLEEADQFTEASILEAARRAARWVLVAETHGPADFPASTPVINYHTPGSGLILPLSGCFQKLWQELHCDSRRLHYVWSRENGRLCCAMRPVSAQERSHLEIEHVADFPEIELRILAIPKEPPLLAEVVFPANMTIEKAKDFIYRELEEVAIQCLGSGAWLADKDDVFLLHLRAIPRADTVCLELENGLREWVVPESIHTCRLEFARGTGWTRPRVDQWLRHHLDLRDLGRTMALQVPYRMAAGLACPLNDILFAGAYPAPSGPGDQGSLEFVAVPPLRIDKRPDDKRKPAAPSQERPAWPREGAGLEIDLSAQRSSVDRLPAELRAELPRQGYANYLEAQALVSKLEELVQTCQSDTLPVAVIALYEGQSALLRRLVDRSEIMRASRDQVEIGHPGALLDREWTTVLVSLTRSHVHRAVPLGARPADLVHALTRARRRLILFGDPGALVKRSHWQGRLDCLDAPASALESRRITALVRWLAGSHPI